MRRELRILTEDRVELGEERLEDREQIASNVLDLVEDLGDNGQELGESVFERPGVVTSVERTTGDLGARLDLVSAIASLDSRGR